ncbi:rhomboid-like protein [Anaeramoeba ignava]|uniref:rhomboid protease n=1 Tax=Anaeramoeba ignava TaxID=1746090 RepID=A0A9Q0R4U3_ANAIG|nr:rhomboid-like protein [Anaeramoeba ignava]
MSESSEIELSEKKEIKEEDKSEDKSEDKKQEHKHKYKHKHKHKHKKDKKEKQDKQDIEMGSDSENKNTGQMTRKRSGFGTWKQTFRGTLGFLPKEEQKEHDKQWQNFSTFRRKARPLLEHQETLQLHFDPNQTGPENAQNIDGEWQPTFVSSDDEPVDGGTKTNPDDPNKFTPKEKAKARAKAQAQAKLYEEPQKEHKPYFIWIVSLVDVVMMIVALVKNHGFESFQLNPWGGPSQQTLVDLGAKDGPKIKDGQWWRFITPIFLHVGIIHLLLNLSFQWRGGKQIEQSVGTIRVAIIYMLAGIGGNLLSVVFLPNLVQVGASGALFGLLAVLLCDLLQNWKQIYEPKSSLIKMIVVIILSFGLGLLPAVDNFAHIGGFVVGLLSGIILMPYINFGKTRKILVLIAIPLLIAYYVILFAVFYRDIEGDAWCSFCKYANCIPVKGWCDNLDGTEVKKTDIQS